MIRFDPSIPPRGPHGPGATPRPDRPEPARPDDASFADALGAPARTGPAPTPAARPTPSAGARRVQEVVRESLRTDRPRAEALERIAEERLRRVARRAPPARLVQRVAAQLDSDPHVAALYGRLCTSLARN